MSNDQPGIDRPGPIDARDARARAKADKAYAKASRPWFKKKRVILPAALLALIVLASAFSGGDEPTETAQPSGSGSATSSASTDSEPKETPAPKVKPMRVRAAKILKEFEGNEAAADAKYGGKLLRVSGVVDKVDTDLLDEEEYIVRVNGGGEFEFLTVNCPGQASSVAAKVNKGDRVSVVGEFDDGGDLGIELEDCKVT